MAEAPKFEPPAQSAARPRTEPLARAAPQPARVPVPEERAAAVEPPKQAVESVVAAPVAPAAPQAPVSNAEAQATAAAADGLDAEAVARFRLELLALASKNERYPRIARENDWQGRVDLRIAFGADGSISSITVKKSAGRAVLDEEAQAMFRAAKSEVPIPPRLRGKAFTLECSVTFVLKKEQK